jgi:TatD DNase family protein
MVMIDTHTHLYSSDFDQDRAAVFSRAQAAGVGLMLLPAIDKSHFKAMWHTAEHFPVQTKVMIGLHPCSVQQDFEEELELVCGELQNNREKYVAVGEIGIDLYWDKTTLGIQTEAFRTQLRLAKEFELPVAIHIRNSFDEVFSVLKEEASPLLRGVLHCFTGGKRHVAMAREIGFYMGIGGVVTYPNSGIDHVLKRILPEEILLETDAPYLTPVPHRHERNEPSFLPLIVSKIAEIKGMTTEEVIEITTTNARKLFKL